MQTTTTTTNNDHDSGQFFDIICINIISFHVLIFIL